MRLASGFPSMNWLILLYKQVAKRAKKKHCLLDSENAPQPEIWRFRPAEADGKIAERK
jgi:hypothetical protein